MFQDGSLGPIPPAPKVIPRTSTPPCRMTPRDITLQKETHSQGLSPAGKVDAGPATPQVHQAEAQMIEGCHGLMPNASLSTISRTVSLSFQSTFHLSITLLVCYRSLANI